MKANVHPLDIVFRLAEDHGIVLLNGSGFAAPDWSVRISFANLDDHVYDDIGRAVRAIARGYRAGLRGSHRQERSASRDKEGVASETLGRDVALAPCGTMRRRARPTAMKGEKDIV